jgi:hypothetical protein
LVEKQKLNTQERIFLKRNKLLRPQIKYPIKNILKLIKINLNKKARANSIKYIQIIK